MAERRIALVLGSARELWADLAGLGPWATSVPVVLAVNDAGWIYQGRIDHWVTLHPEHLENWRRRRHVTVGGLPDDYQTWGPRNKRDAAVDHYVGHWGPGSSSFFAVKIALEDLGCDRAVLAGVPMAPGAYADPSAGSWGTEGWPLDEVRIHREGWEHHKDRLIGRVRSCSGWTRDLLGAPDVMFLQGD